MPQLTLALDWTPNINHIGFFVAREKGFYNDLGIDLHILDPSADQYAATPAKKVEWGQADLALCPTESVISYRTKQTPFDLIGIGTIFQHDLSAIAVLAKGKINRPRDLDGKKYASYQARYEDEIVRQMIQNDGGSGQFEIEYPAKLGIWETILDRQFDATWIFLNWEGVAAENLGVSLRLFNMRDYQVPYSYSPLIAASNQKIQSMPDLYRAFLQATRKGFLFAQDHPTQAITVLQPLLSESDQGINLTKALALSTPAFGTPDNWGQMALSEVDQFLLWLRKKGLESTPLTSSELVTNAFLPS
ncbi:MAG: ABC transporter substrate-binding protein [Bacteroidota bacterium]